MNLNTPANLVGADIGQAAIVIAWSDGSRQRARWPVQTLDLTNPDWYVPLLELLTPGSIICAEPTGWHYLQPLAAVVHQMTPATLYLVSHEASAAARQHFSGAKTDAMDARALAYIAELIAAGDPPRSIQPYDPAAANVLVDLRLWCNERARAVREATRARNQITTFGHSLWPTLAQRKATWLALVEQGAVTPREIKAYVAAVANQPGIDGRRLRYQSALANDLPDIDTNPVVRAMIVSAAERMRAADARTVTAELELARLVDHPSLVEVTRRWRTIPGCTDYYLAALHVAAHGAAHLLTPDEFKAVVGVNPKSSQSGGRDKTRLTRKGYRPALNALWTWAMYLVKTDAPPNPVQAYHLRKDDFFASRAKLARLLSGVARDPAGYRHRE